VYEENIFHYVNQETGTLDYITGIEMVPGLYTFQIDRYSNNGKSNVEIAYNVEENTTDNDDTSYLTSIEAHINKRGFQLPQGAWITSLSGVKINNTDNTKIIKLHDMSIEGDVYDGVISLNHAPFPFLYNDSSQQILFGGKPLTNTTGLFSGNNNWEDRRANLDEFGERISISEFGDLHFLNLELQKVIAQTREEHQIGASVYSLEGRISSDLEPFILSIVKSRLVTHAQDLIE